MLGIDPRSFVVITAAFGILCSFVLFALHSGFPRDIKGLARWGRGCAFMATAAALLSMRGAIPSVFSNFLSDLLIISGVGAIYGSLQEFTGVAPNTRRVTALFFIAALGLAWVTFAHDDYRVRVLIMSGVLTILFSACAWVIIKSRDKGFPDLFTQYLFIGTAGITFARFITAIFEERAVTFDKDFSLIRHVYLGTFAFSTVGLTLGFILMVNRALHSKLEYLASRDHMTGAYRRDAFMQRLDDEIAAAERQCKPLALLMMDLDNFKSINDRYGHTVGDHVIRDFADKLTHELRHNDCVGRYGGEEFIVLLPHTGEVDAKAIAERIRDAAAQHTHGDIPAYTVSIGLALLSPPTSGAQALIDAADKAMYMAKQAGKNKVEIASVEMQELL
ncbi:GGDEF domain-containing protein [Noviherbaspirillum pedocola]|uniref:diguanylate cyclase n=1 Tax=Noviherbaspirillum pedocola TaxID=2801341 RepID=A0A934T323_9BURK|nr:GGDEF domain-containing protein [Noviherbaspirillum pedocola]MBK4737363.1 GGDEF domain-containing protein [Noviherbaspirillum pedocola]